MFKFILDILFGVPPEYMPPDLFNTLRKDHPELKTRDNFADWMVDNLGSTYGEAYSALPKHYFQN